MHGTNQAISGARGTVPLRFTEQTVEVFRWLAQIVSALWRIQPRVSGLVIGANVLARFTSMAAFLLPLKVLLLAGSDGVPRYFGFMAQADHKLHWIMALSIAAATFFIVTRLLRSLSERLSQVGSQQVLKQANQLSLFGNQGDIARRHYQEVSTLCADLIFLTVACTALVFINPLLMCGMVLLCIIQYLSTAVILRQPIQLANRIRSKPGDYLTELQTLNFWVAFVLILVPLIVRTGANILLAILAFVLIRQALAALSRAIGTVISLARERHLIDALAFPTHRWQRNYSRAQSFHSLFEKQTHLQKIESVLSSQFQDPTPINLHWKDYPLGGISTFLLTAGTGANGPYYQEQVFAPHCAHLITNEEILFEHFSREALGAPVVGEVFTHGSYHCRLCHYYTGQIPSRSLWSSRFPNLLERLWSIEPSDTLTKAFSTSHLLLHERLTPELLRGLALAVKNQKDLSMLIAFEAALPAIRHALSAMPLHVWNRDIFRSNSVLRADGEIIIMTWGRWRLEPLGVYISPKTSKTKLSEMLERVSRLRPKIRETLTPDHLTLARACHQLHLRVLERQYEAALSWLPAILNSPALPVWSDIRSALNKVAVHHPDTGCPPQSTWHSA